MTSEDGEGDWIRLGGLVDSSRVTICFYGDDLEPDELTRLLGMAPTHAHRPGDPVLSTRFRNTYKKGAWILDLDDVEGADPEDAIIQLLQWLPVDDPIWLELTAAFDVRIGLSLVLKDWTRGFSLGAATLERLGALGLRLDVEIWYMPNPNEII
ncbi:MAG TPA: DUF4279 domain-containing protein [Dehalococcoidia bacterium]|nr:DUF4279 domain-containing protein [Dehalococcoidia bacterium]